MSTWKNEVFRAVKSENKNMVIYTAVPKADNEQLLDGINCFWVMNETDGHIEDINWIEKKMCYGMIISKKEDDEIIFALKALPEMPIRVKWDKDKFIAVTSVEGRDVIVESVFTTVTTVILIKPTIHSVVLRGKDAETMEDVEVEVYHRK